MARGQKKATMPDKVKAKMELTPELRADESKKRVGCKNYFNTKIATTAADQGRARALEHATAIQAQKKPRPWWDPKLCSCSTSRW
jgi:hypothetical protein